MVILVSWCLAQYSGTATAVQQYSSAEQYSIATQSSSAAVHNSRVAREKQQCISSAAVQYCAHKSMQCSAETALMITHTKLHLPISSVSTHYIRGVIRSCLALRVTLLNSLTPMGAYMRPTF